MTSNTNNQFAKSGRPVPPLPNNECRAPKSIAPNSNIGSVILAACRAAGLPIFEGERAVVPIASTEVIPSDPDVRAVRDLHTALGWHIMRELE